MSSRRKIIKGQHDQGQQAWEVLREKSASERVSEREVFRGFLRGFQRFSEVFQRPSQRPSQSAIFLSELRVVLPLIVLPLKTPARVGRPRRVFSGVGGWGPGGGVRFGPVCWLGQVTKSLLPILAHFRAVGTRDLGSSSDQLQTKPQSLPTGWMYSQGLPRHVQKMTQSYYLWITISKCHLTKILRNRNIRCSSLKKCFFSGVSLSIKISYFGIWAFFEI